MCFKITCNRHWNEEEVRKFSEISICSDGHANQNVAKNRSSNLGTKQLIKSIICKLLLVDNILKFVEEPPYDKMFLY